MLRCSITIFAVLGVTSRIKNFCEKIRHPSGADQMGVMILQDIRRPGSLGMSFLSSASFGMVDPPFQPDNQLFVS